MYLKKEHIGAGCRYLLVLRNNTCFKRKLPDLTEGSNRLSLGRIDAGDSLDEEIVLESCEGSWQIDGKKLSDQFPVSYHTKEKEKILFLVSGKIEFLEPAGRILMEEGQSIQIGKAYTNQVFYEYHSLVNQVHAKIVCRKQEGISIQTREEGVYVNNKVVKGEQRLYTGDRITIYGLHLLMINNMLIGAAFCGVARMAACRVLPGKACVYEKITDREKFVSTRDLPERSYEQEKELHTGEVEVVMPGRTARGPYQPFLLSLGPALTMVLPMLLMAQLGSRSVEGSGSGFYTMSLVMSGTTALLTVFWGLINHEYSKYNKRREERGRERQYREYLKEMEAYLTDCQRENRRILERKYPPVRKLICLEGNRAVVFWNRYYRQKDFLFFRLGEGEMDFQIQVKLSGEIKGILPGKLSQAAQEMAEKFAVLTQVPVGVDLFQNRQIGSAVELLLPLLLQIAAYHCYTEVRIACFYQSEREMDQKIANCLKWLPHCWSTDRKIRFLAGNEQEAGEILPGLTREIIQGAVENREEISIPWYVVVVLNEELIMGETLYQCLTDSRGMYPASVLFAGARREDIPKSCCFFLSGTKQQGDMLRITSERISRRQFLPDDCGFLEAERYARKITGLRVREEEESTLPEKVEFLQLFGCRKVTELESGRRWKQARPEERLKAPVGCRSGGNLISLDVHEKFHGPHGLIAGTTGSGKSELLQTYLLSMAVSYSPEDINFFMIDYKGGGTGNIIKNLPHCAGVISNLSGKQIKRAMSAISSENKRRQKILSEFQVNHIDGYFKLYREGGVTEPMPHLILVVDEFAELKKEEPEFMQEIISLAQVGRSLGVHLILATQKPAGTVDDKIWSNARFRLCLKVQDRQDSMDMLKNGDAAMLTAPGQCYMQIGNQEYYELFQAGYCGGIYKESDKEKAKAVMVSGTGRRTERKGSPGIEKGQEQIQVLVDYVNQIAQKNDYKSAVKLWLPELPDLVGLEELINREKEQEKEEWPYLILGLCDDPERQQQIRLDYQPVIQGHLAVCGGPGTGKTTFLQTILWQLCREYSPGQAQVLIVSLWQESLECFYSMPGCLGVLKDRENIGIFFHHLSQLVSGRRKQLSGIGCRQYNKSSGNSLPYVFLIIDNFGSFEKELDDEQEEFLLKLVSEGISLGIYVILTAIAVSEIGSRIFGKIKTAMALEMSDRFQYGDILRQYYIPVLPQENKKGRGLCRLQENVLEFQGALVFAGMEDYERVGRIAKESAGKAEDMRKKNQQIPDKIPFLPDKPEYKKLIGKYRKGADKIPVGYCLDTGVIREISPKERKCFLISGNEKTGRSAFLNCMIEGFLKIGGQAVIVDEKKRLGHWEGKNGVIYLSDEEKVNDWQKNAALPDAALSKNAGRKEDRMKGIFVTDMESFCGLIYHYGEQKKERTAFWEEIAQGKKKEYFFAGIYNPLRDMEISGTAFFRIIAMEQSGICLGGNLASQRVFTFDDLSYSEQNKYQPPGIGYLKEGGGSPALRLLLPVY